MQFFPDGENPIIVTGGEQIAFIEPDCLFQPFFGWGLSRGNHQAALE